MSILTRLHRRELGEIDLAIEKMKLLEVEVDLRKASELYVRLSDLGTYTDKSKTPPGVKGFDLGQKALLILAGHEDPEYIQEYSEIECEDRNLVTTVIDKPRPFNILFKTNSPDAKLERALQRGFRLGVYIIGNLSPQIEYLDTNIQRGEESALAVHLDSNRALIGRRLSQDTIGNINIGYSPGIFPTNADEVFSYTVEDVN